MAFSFRNPAAEFSTAPFVLESGEANLKIAGVTAKILDEKDGVQAKGIIEVKLRVADGEFEGKPVSPAQCWNDDDGGNSQVMRWVLAALGIKPGSEEADNEFKEKFPDIDLGFDDDLKPADGWKQVIGNVVTCSVQKPFNAKMDRYENKYQKIRPFGT